MSVQAPATTADALDLVRAGLSYLAAVDPATLPARAQAECLAAFKRFDAIAAAAHPQVLVALVQEMYIRLLPRRR